MYHTGNYNMQINPSIEFVCACQMYTSYDWCYTMYCHAYVHVPHQNFIIKLKATRYTVTLLVSQTVKAKNNMDWKLSNLQLLLKTTQALCCTEGRHRFCSLQEINTLPSSHKMKCKSTVNHYLFLNYYIIECCGVNLFWNFLLSFDPDAAWYSVHEQEPRSYFP